MHVYIVFAHPGEDSFSREILGQFTNGLAEAGHTYETGDLYSIGFESEMDAEQYRREVGLDPGAPVPDDVRSEQEKIARADALAFIYPVWWSDCPAKLKGWFDRVFTYGYAYFYDDNEERHTEIEIKKAVVICSAGHTLEHLEETGIAESMKRIMLDDRLLGVGVREARMEILGGMMPKDDTYRRENLEKAYDIGKNL
ncbi:MAG: NAD(P)H-dependent oxidoreductase [Candidatus Krumholzibacteriota bacterium]|nr:NAD(P)H-dependent oxidoreductase [Candidatus Krumholzibacteriota bacterium]